MKKAILMISGLILLLGCNISAEEKMQYTVLMVENHSQKDIFVSLVSKQFKETFGGIPPGKSAGIGFSPLRFEDETTIQYSEETIDENNRFVIRTKGVSEYKGEIDEIIFRYLGNGQWVLILLDTEGHEVVFE